MIKIDDMYKIYKMGSTNVYALNGINICIEPKEFVAIVGQSGSGKSTLMNMIGCLDKPTSGEYYFYGNRVTKMKENELADIRNNKLGFIFQSFNLLSKLSALENVELPLIYKGIEKRKRYKMAHKALERVGLANRVNHKPTELSGGQQQRVAIARALSSKPPMILADEPTGALDTNSGQEIMKMIKELNDEGKTIVLITHEYHIANQAKRIIQLQDGKVVEDSGVV